jgi:hypothetical protein
MNIKKVISNPLQIDYHRFRYRRRLVQCCAVVCCGLTVFKIYFGLAATSTFFASTGEKLLHGDATAM